MGIIAKSSRLGTWRANGQKKIYDNKSKINQRKWSSLDNLGLLQLQDKLNS